MNNNSIKVKQARKSFDRILDHHKYAGIIRDDEHLSLILNMVKDNGFHRILDIGTGTGYLAFPLAEQFPNALVYGIDIAQTMMRKNNEIVAKRGLTNLAFRAFDGFMQIKQDGHIQFYSSEELDDLFDSNGFVKEQQVISQMKFPFPPKPEYLQLYNITDETHRLLYGISNIEDIIWINHIDVGNAVYVKE